MALTAGLLVSTVACGGKEQQVKAPVAPPDPESVSRDAPGGDSADPHFSALRRLLLEPWGRRQDKDAQLLLPFTDTANWKRVRFSLVEHFTGFRYGEDNHAVTVTFIHELPKGVSANPFECMRLAEQWAQPQLRDFGVDVDNFREEEVDWQNGKDRQPLLVHVADAHLDVGFDRWEGTAAWIAYPAYEDACVTHAMAVPWRGHRALAESVVTRWVEEGAERVRPKTEKRPYRIE
jgi:hypothetical protein